MSKITAKVLAKKFTYKGKTYLKGDEVVVSPQAAELYSGLDVLELSKEAEKKLEAPAKK